MIRRVPHLARRFGFPAIATVIFLISLLMLVAGGGDKTSPSPTAQLSALTQRRAAARHAADAKYSALLASMKGFDAVRVRQDTAAVRTLVLALASSSSSTLPTSRRAQVLSERFPVLSATSEVRTDFLPRFWKDNDGHLLRLSALDVRLTDVLAARYDYTAVATLRDSGGDPQRVLLRISTSGAGHISDVSASVLTHISTTTPTTSTKDE